MNRQTDQVMHRHSTFLMLYLHVYHDSSKACSNHCPISLDTHTPSVPNAAIAHPSRTSYCPSIPNLLLLIHPEPPITIHPERSYYHPSRTLLLPIHPPIPSLFLLPQAHPCFHPILDGYPASPPAEDRIPHGILPFSPPPLRDQLAAVHLPHSLHRLILLPRIQSEHAREPVAGRLVHDHLAMYDGKSDTEFAAVPGGRDQRAG